MPNGRSGWFQISLVQFRQLLQSLPGSTRVAGLPRTSGLTASDVEQQLNRYRRKDIVVEEQDHKWYLAHIMEVDEEHAVVVSEDSPLYEGFRRYHTEWLSQQSVQSSARKSKPWWKFW